MKKFLLGLLFVFALAAPSYAQSSCAKPNLGGTTTNITNPTFLFAIEVVAGSPTPKGFNVTVDGTKADLGNIPPELGSVVCFPASVTVSGNGTHTISTSFYTLSGTGAKQESPQSVPFVLSLGDPVPVSAPINHPR